MALAKCPDCGKMISEFAPACVGCGRPKDAPVQAGESLPLSLDNRVQREQVSAKYEVSANGVKYGPLSLEEVRDRMGQGDFTVNVYVRREGSTDPWVSPTELFTSTPPPRRPPQAQGGPIAGALWVRANGLDYGPYTPSEFRARHERGEFPVNVWLRSEGSAEWLRPEAILKDGRGVASPASHQSPRLKREESSASVAKDGAGFLGGTLHPWRRLYARIIDQFTLGLFALTCSVILVGWLFPQFLAPYSKALDNILIASIVMYLFLIPIEALLLASVGYTPAKWLFGIRVRTREHTRMGFRTSMNRALRVWVWGQGLEIPLISAVAQYMSYRRLIKSGATQWDNELGLSVEHSKWGALRAIACVIATLVVVTMVGQNLVHR